MRGSSKAGTPLNESESSPLNGESPSSPLNGESPSSSLTGESPSSPLNGESPSSSLTGESPSSPLESADVEIDAGTKVEEGSSSIWRQIVGCIAALGTVLFETIAAGCAQALGGLIPEFQVNVWRCLAQLLMTLLGIAVTRVDIRVGKRLLLINFILAVFYHTYNLSLYQATIYLPTGTVAGLSVTAMLLSSLALAFCLTRKYELYLILAVVMCLVGLPLLVQPEFIFGEVAGPERTSICGAVDIVDTTSMYGGNGSEIHQMAPSFNATASVERSTMEEMAFGSLLAALAGCSLSAIIFMINRYMQDVNIFVMAWWTGVGGLIFTVVGMFIAEAGTVEPIFPTRWECWLLLLFQVFAVGSFVFVDYVASTLLSPLIVSLIYAMTPAAFGFAQYTVLRDLNPGHRNLAEGFGIALVIMGSIGGPLYKLYKEYKMAKSKNGHGEKHDGLDGEHEV